MGKTPEPRTVMVWDLPTRLFHWLLVGLMAVSFVTVEIGGNAMRLHAWSGFTILGLVLFRVAWGFAGSTPSRFKTFLVGPRRVKAYVQTLFRPDGPHHLTHNPLGGWSVAAMLAAVLVQAATGLFASDDIMTQGPLNRLVSSQTGRLLTDLHELNAVHRREEMQADEIGRPCRGLGQAGDAGKAVGRGAETLLEHGGRLGKGVADIEGRRTAPGLFDALHRDPANG